MQHINHFRSVVALAEYGHFGRAADAIGLTQSALSQNIQRLEMLYDVPLFVRQRGQISLTAYGEVVQAAARQALDAVTQAQRDISLLQNLEIGHLIVGVDAFLGTSLLGPALFRMLKAHPNLKFTVRTGHWEIFASQLLDEEIDIYIGFPPDHQLPDLTFEPVVIPSPLVLSSRHHEMAKSEETRLGDLVAYPIVSPVPPNWYIRWAQEQIEQFKDRKSVTGPMILESDSIAICKQIIRNNMALMAAMRADVQDELDSGDIVALNLANWPTTMESCIVTKTRRLQSPAAEMLERIYREIAEEEKLSIA